MAGLGSSKKQYHCVTDVVGADLDNKIVQQNKVTFHNDTSTISIGGIEVQAGSNVSINIRDQGVLLNVKKTMVAFDVFDLANNSCIWNALDFF